MSSHDKPDKGYATADSKPPPSGHPPRGPNRATTRNHLSKLTVEVGDVDFSREFSCGSIGKISLGIKGIREVA